MGTTCCWKSKACHKGFFGVPEDMLGLNVHLRLLNCPQGYYDETLMPICVLRISRWKRRGRILGYIRLYRYLLRNAEGKSLNDWRKTYIVVIRCLLKVQAKEKIWVMFFEGSTETQSRWLSIYCTYNLVNGLSTAQESPIVEHVD